MRSCLEAGCGRVETLADWDPDGPGPLPNRLVVGGNFNRAGEFAANNIATWDGNRWQPLGDGFSGGISEPAVWTVAAWDHDANSDTPQQLVAGGEFGRSGALERRNIAAWNGKAWDPLGFGLNALVGALTEFDADADGPQPPVLVVGGRFGNAFGVPNTRNVAIWNGSAWSSIGGGLPGQVTELLLWDSNELDNVPAELYAFGAFAVQAGLPLRVARWDGTAWRSVAVGLNSPVLSAAGWDVDGGGPERSKLAAVGQFSAAYTQSADLCNTKRVNFVSLFDGERWGAIGDGRVNNAVDMVDFDVDGSGPQPPELVVAGVFNRDGLTLLAGVGRWDGAAWKPLASGLGSVSNPLITTSAISRFDPDGPGPLSKRLVVGGSFVSTNDGTTVLNGIAHWDGVAWQPFGSGLVAPDAGTAVNSLQVWDPDGAGPLAERLVAAGSFAFQSAGGFEAKCIAWWDGASWQAFGDVDNQLQGSSANVDCMTTFDPDGAGPTESTIVIGGTFVSAGGVTLNGVARWDGASWQPFANGLNNGGRLFVYALTQWDSDGAGPTPGELYAGGNFTVVDGAALNGVARWDGAAWQSLAGGLTGTPNEALVARTFAEWDPDGAGPDAPQLIVGGAFTHAGDVAAQNLARWDGLTWRPLGSGTVGSVNALLVTNVIGANPLGPALLVGGSLTNAGGLSASGLAIYRPGALELAAEPLDRAACDFSAAEFGVAIEGGSGDVSYRWRRDGQPLSDDGRISGAASATLRIDPTIEEDSGHYDCVVEDACATITTAAATLSIEITLADMNCDCFVNVGDIGAFVVALTDPETYAVLYPSCAAELADLTNDGQVTTADIGPFVTLLTR
ncbi:MAG: hypothetical protein SF069_09145 [Phycisphaerae bacterium]|nr:hypothetical protein [Phycisphaerae bacterium]